jgi:hypothetical protein
MWQSKVSIRIYDESFDESLWFNFLVQSESDLPPSNLSPEQLQMMQLLQKNQVPGCMLN